MKVLFIQPPSTKKFEIIPLGLAYLTSVLQEDGHTVIVIDACSPYFRITFSNILKQIKSFSPDIVGITFTTALCQEAYRLSEEISRLNILTVAGGAHPTVLPQEALERGFDIVVRGEGEKTILELIRFKEGKLGLSQINGISYKDQNGQIINNSNRAFISDLDEIPFPSRYIFPLKNYARKQSSEYPGFFWSILTSRGCPNFCTYCSSYALGKKYRFRSAKNIYAEIKQLQSDFNIKYFRFLDDTLTANTDRLNELLDLIISDRDFNIRWDCDSRVDTISRGLLLKMKLAGCNGINYGVESSDPITLTKIKKGITIQDINNAISASRDAGIIFVINLIIGFPWEDEDNIQNVLDFIKSIPNDSKCYHQYSLPIPFPNTQLYREYHKEYGFTDWWLKENAYEYDYDNTGYIAFYKLYMRYLNHPFLKNNFFKYQPYIRKKIINTFIVAGRLSNKRMFGVFSEKIIYILSSLSCFLYKINPLLEKFIFKIIRAEWIKKLIKNTLNLLNNKKEHL